ncbi:hypothetical protein JW756_01460 [Candidatus Woesearchaeota archaeon]|nr:hypothetical protein [Candidatus Woesearchaeota archaeon]
MLKKRLFNRKGFTLQFNWIFVLIAGAVFLGFFFSVIANQSSSADKSSAQEATLELDNLLKISSASENTQRSILFDKAGKKIFFTSDVTSEYYVEGALKSSRYDYNVIFSPSEIKSDELVILTRIFNAPFKIMPFVYITDKDIEYVFVGSLDSPLLNAVFDAMPEDATKKFIDTSEVAVYEDNNYEHTVFIFDDEYAPLGVGQLNFVNGDKRLFAVVIKPAQGVLLDYGEMIFSTYSPEAGFVGNNADAALYLGLDSILGGVISHDKTIYEHNFKKSLLRLELLAQLYQQRMIYYSENTVESCSDAYIGAENSAALYLANIQEYSGKKEPLLPDIYSLFLAVNDLRTLNNYLLQKTNCPRIY